LQAAALADLSFAPGAVEVPLADGFQYPVGHAGREVFADFYVATDFLDPSYFKTFGTWHPGEDWNGKGGGDTDLGEAVYAVAHGRVVAGGHFTPSWGNILLVEHLLPDGSRIWSQYAHLQDSLAAEGDVVARGQQIGTIGKGDKNRWPAHLHFEIRTQEMAPNVWRPIVDDPDQVRARYTNPRPFIRSHLAEQFAYKPPQVGQDIVVDTGNSDVAAGTFRKAQSQFWWNAPHGFRGDTLWTYASPEHVENWGEWRPRLPEAGRYEVSVFVPREHATTRAAKYQVNHRDGRTEVVVDQSRYFDRWVSLGTFGFAEGTAGYLRLTDVTGESFVTKRQVAFDAARWIRILEG
jgi:hypothetical protein